MNLKLHRSELFLWVYVTKGQQSEQALKNKQKTYLFYQTKNVIKILSLLKLKCIKEMSSF